MGNVYTLNVLVMLAQPWSIFLAKMILGVMPLSFGARLLSIIVPLLCEQRRRG